MKDASAAPQSAGDDRSGPFTLLVVDDDSAWRDALKMWLEQEKFRVVMLGRADWVSHAVELHRPDVVLLDVNLPGASGLDVLDSLARRWPSLPVIIMTAFGGPGVGDTARRLGAAAYLEKPFRMTTLVNEIRRAGPRRNGERLPAGA
jgi:DNA-binding NtrC family response regulator